MNTAFRFLNYVAALIVSTALCLGVLAADTVQPGAADLPAIAQWPADAAFPGAGPLQKADWFQKLWAQRRVKWSQEVAKDKGAVVFLGDSITQGWGSLAKDFPRTRVANRGISGDVTRGVRFRLPDDVVAVEPSAVVLLIGTNDLGLGGNPEDTAANLKEIIAALKASSTKLPVVWCKVMPRQAQFASKIQRLNQIIEDSIGNDPRVVICDTWTIFANEQGSAKKEEFPDLLHPNAVGYGKWAGALQPILVKLDLSRAAK